MRTFWPRRGGGLLLAMGLVACLRPNPEYEPKPLGVEDQGGGADLSAAPVDLAAAPDLRVVDLALPPDLAPPPAPAGMVTVRGGTFQMGTPEGSGSDNERPVNSQTVATFYLDQTEVTVAAYRTCVQTQGCSAPDDSTVSSYCNWTTAAGARENHPINCVDWNQAKAYCEKQGKRLPLETEWEYAARGSAGSTYPWGNDAPGSQLCWSGGGTSRSSTCPVGSFGKTLLGAADPSGVADLAGNVWEWVQESYCSYPLDGKGGGTNCNNSYRIFRGGSWVPTGPLLRARRHPRQLRAVVPGQPRRISLRQDSVILKT